MRKLLLFVVILTFIIFSTLPAAPSDRWEPAIAAFEAADRVQYPPPGATVFIGSSSIRAWTTLAEDFRGLPVVNRGFGGSQMEDAARYVDRIVAQYGPLAVVLYEGDNDIAAGKSPEMVAANFGKFVAAVRSKMPVIPVYVISIKPSLARWSIWPRMKEANELIQARCAQARGVYFIDVAPPMLGSDGTPRTDIFVSDGLHLNRKGYDIWTAAVKPFLEGKNRK
ncbi:MAG TPA: SGNH/GDSL hydrolase family protein [Candidatus Glassbacteria bacterium]|nr:SGNH/GDSL hydrolase family protein [Candidatus Glassbacteria bacterium]